MNIEELREFCLSLKGVKEDFPFDETVLVFKIGSKMFCLTDLKDSRTVALKNDPETNIELREKYHDITPGYHMNKKHWNTITLNGSIPDLIIRNLIVESYEMVILSLPKKQQEQIKNI